MKNLSKAFLLLISIITLTSCMTADEARIKFNNEPEQRLCMDFLTLPTYNIWYESRRTAIINRGHRLTGEPVEGVVKYPSSSDVDFRTIFRFPRSKMN